MAPTNTPSANGKTVITLPLLSIEWCRLTTAFETEDWIEVQIRGATRRGYIVEKRADRFDNMQRPFTDFIFRPAPKPTDL